MGKRNQLVEVLGSGKRLKGLRVDALYNPNTTDRKQPGYPMPMRSCYLTGVCTPSPWLFSPPFYVSYLFIWVTNLFLLVQREEKQLEASLDALLSQVADLKNSLGSFICKLENEYGRLTWPSVLDSFALLSGQLNTLNKVLKHEKTPLFRNQVIIPLVLSPDRDEDLMRQTEGRVPVFSHEVVPDHLRTKPDPEQVQMAGAPSQQQPMLSGVQMAQAGQPGKMPSGIKTNIKSASMHPYQR
uniref:Mediator of RNA polymerase II transcription subunit 8 n=1 Tax=Cercocebus atys TaxID=9531 RepID=A0A2K5MPU7_CERAT